MQEYQVQANQHLANKYVENRQQQLINERVQHEQLQQLNTRNRLIFIMTLRKRISTVIEKFRDMPASLANDRDELSYSQIDLSNRPAES